MLSLCIFECIVLLVIYIKKINQLISSRSPVGVNIRSIHRSGTYSLFSYTENISFKSIYRMIHIRSCASVALLNSCVPVTASSAWREIQQHIRHAASSQVRVRKEISCVMTAMPHTKCASHIHIRIVFPYPVFPLFIMHETLLNLPGLIYN